MDELSQFKADYRRIEADPERANLPVAVAASFDRESGCIGIRFSNGCRFEFPAALAQGLQTATAEELEQVRVVPGGETLSWDGLDVDHSVNGLLQFVFGTKKWLQTIGEKGGRARSAAKADAARRNGLKGGRPRRTTPARKKTS